MNDRFARLYQDSEMEGPESHDCGPGEVVSYSRSHPEKDSANEDGAMIVGQNDRVVLAVADGMGGSAAGDKASTLTLRHLRNTLTRALAEGGDLRGCILDGFESANRAVAALGVGAGTTLAVVEVHKDRLRCYHVGDSAILLVGQRGRVKLLSTSHSPTGFAVEAGLMGEAEALVHEDRHLVSNVLGDPNMTIEMSSPRIMAPRDTLLLGSDGLFDNLTSEEITEAIRTGPLARAAERLATTCGRRMAQASDETPSKPGKPDDLTFLLFRRKRRRRLNREGSGPSPSGDTSP